MFQTLKIGSKDYDDLATSILVVPRTGPSGYKRPYVFYEENHNSLQLDSFKICALIYISSEIVPKRRLI